jgi:hypothetical protein
MTTKPRSHRLGSLSVDTGDVVCFSSDDVLRMVQALGGTAEDYSAFVERFRGIGCDFHADGRYTADGERRHVHLLSSGSPRASTAQSGQPELEGAGLRRRRVLALCMGGRKALRAPTRSRRGDSRRLRPARIGPFRRGDPRPPPLDVPAATPVAPVEVAA